MSDLTEQLRELAKSVPQQAGPELEGRLLAEFRRHSRRRMYLMHVAAVIILGLALSFAHFYGANRVITAQRPEPETPPGFMPLPYSESGVPLGQGIVMRVQLPVSELNDLGVAVPPGMTRQRVSADVLIGQDGMARAVRFVQ